MHPAQAAAEAANRRIRRATGLLRDASRDLAAALDDDTPPLGVLNVHDADTADAARDLIAVGVGRYGAVEVLVLPRPTRRHRHTPTTAHQGEGDPA